jgi:uncharacterized YccA/Bax inhibitor family protein
MRSGNPALRADTFRAPRPAAAGDRMTIGGTVNKTFLLAALLLISAAWMWSSMLAEEGPQRMLPWVFGGAIGGLIIAIVTIIKKNWAPVTAPLYALAEGLVVGGLSVLMEQQFPGIVLQAVGLTVATLIGLLVAYRSGLIKVTDNFRLGVVAATGGIFLVYLASWILGMFGVQVPYLHDGGPIGIAISLFIVAIAALNLVLDFDFIEHGAELGAPRYMEWFAAFGLMVTLIWLYLEILRLLAKTRR